MGNILAAIFAAAVTCLVTGEATAAKLKLLTTNGMRAVLKQVGPQFERESGHQLEVEYGAGPVLKKRIEAGDAFDVAILPFDISDLIQQGRIVAATRTVLGHTGYGAAVRKGAPKPDIGTIESFRRTLLNSKSVAFTADGASGTYVLNMIKRLGIADEMQAKLKQISGGAESGPVAAVASGEAELAVAGIPVIVGGAGIDIIGWLPRDVQSYLVFTVGVSGSAADKDAAGALIKTLTTPGVIAVFRSAGIEPAAP